MKKILYFAAFAALFAFTACQEKETLDLEQGSCNEAGEYPVFTASIDFGGTKAYTRDGETITWSYNEVIKITDNKSKTATYTAEPSGNGGKFATLKIKEGTNPPKDFGTPPFTAKINSMPAKIQDYNYFAENDKLYLTALSSTVVDDKPADNSLVFTAQNALLAIKFKLNEKFEAISVKGSDAAGKVKTYTLLVDDNEAFDSPGWKMDEQHTYLVAVEAGRYDEIKILKSATNVCVVKANPPIEVAANDYVPITLADSKIKFEEVDVLPGFFTVDEGPDNTEGTEDDIRVNFSKGNIRYIVGTANWELFEKQYDFCNTSLYEGHHSDTISLFSWGYDSVKSIVPNSNQTVDSDPINVTLEQGSHFLSRSQDWGTRIGDGETWRTLTSREWQYLLMTALQPKHEVRYVRGAQLALKYRENVTVCGVSGCLAIVPDDWDTSKIPIQEEYSNTSTPMTWEQAQCAGLVCLPPAGNRLGTNISNVGSLGYYWSSSHSVSNIFWDPMSYSQSPGYASVGTSVFGANPGSNGYSYAYCSSVRLVTNMK